MASQLTTHARGLCVFRCALVAAACMVASSSAAETRPEYGGIVVSSLLEEPLAVDPIAAQTQTDLKLAYLLFDTLYRMEEGQLVPHLASKMPDQSDPLVAKIALRKRVLFHNGQVMRASDVVASLERLKKSERGHLLANMKSFSVQKGTADEGAVRIELRKPDPKLATRLSAVHTSVTSKGRAPTWRRLVGSGPFRLNSRSTRRKELRLTAHQTYFAGRAYADELRLHWFEKKTAEARSYETGSSHISVRGQIAFAGHRPKYKTSKRSADAEILVYLGFGKSSSLIKERSFRLALAAAIGRAGMKQIGNGEPVVPTLSPLPRSARGTVLPSAGLTANPSKSNALLKELGRKYSSLEAGSLLLDILVNASRPDDAIVGGRVAAALVKLGIQSRMVSVHANVFVRRVASGQCDLYIGQLATPAQIPEDTLRNAFVAGGFAKLLPELAKRGSAGMERQFAKHQPLIPLFHRGLRVHHRTNLRDLKFDSSARLRYEDMYFFGNPEKN